MTVDTDPHDVIAWGRHLGGAPPDDLRQQLGAGTIAELLATLPTRSGGRLRVGGEVVRYGDLPGVVGGVAARLVERGHLRRLARIVLLLPSSLDLVLVYLAVVSRGGAAVLANPSATSVEIERLIEASGADAVVCDRGLSHLVGGIRSGVAVVEPSTVTSGDPQELHVDASPDDPAILAFTSGTTGTPKAVPLRHRHLLASIRGAAWSWRIDQDDHIVHALPLFHQHGLSAIHAAMAAGPSVTIAPSFGPDLLSLAAEVRATVLFAVPTMYRRLLDDHRFGPGSLPDLRLAVSGSAALPTDLFAAIEERLGMPPLERYGTTESGLDISNLYDGLRRAGSVGVPLPGVEVRLRRADGGDVAEGEPGEVCIRGPQVFDGYLDDDASTEATMWPGGWFRTGDIGVCDVGSGPVSIVGRLKEMIVSGGMNVYPAEVEDVLARHPGVEEVAVAGRPSDRWGEEVVAFVVRRAEVSTTDLLALVKTQLAPYKCPKDVVFVSELPRNAMGKVVRTHLVDESLR